MNKACVECGLDPAGCTCGWREDCGKDFEGETASSPSNSLPREVKVGAFHYLEELERQELPYPWCRGNPTKQDCIEAGYCRRDPNCGE